MKRKVMTILGTRPEIIRLSLVIPLLDRWADHTVVHTGQNFHEQLSDVFFRELAVRAPNKFLGIRGTGFGEIAGAIMSNVEKALLEYRPDRVLILGDTNSGLAALVARRLGIAVYHMEAGNRCFDDRVPEEVNRRVIDHSSSVLMPYTERSRQNLIAEGIPGDRILVTGNPIKQVIDAHAASIARSDVLSTLGIEKKRYFLVTLHRAENVDREDRLRELVASLAALHREYGLPMVVSLHPRTRSKLEKFEVDIAGAGIIWSEPFGFFDFIKLEQEAFCLLSDSGTVQEEACIFGVPNVTVREVTERPETIECGSNILAMPATLSDAVAQVVAQKAPWQPPPEYLTANVAETVCRIVVGDRIPDLAEREWLSGIRH